MFVTKPLSMKKKLISLFIAGLFCTGAKFFAQNSYSFSKSASNTYTDLGNDTNIPNFDPNTGLYTLPTLQNETFKFFGLDFTLGGSKTISFGEYPFLRIDNDSSAIIIDAAFTYIDTIDANSKISYVVEGTPGNHLLKLQYKNFKLSTGQPGNYINVQIWCYQKTGVIEIHYGPRSANNASGYNTVTGPNVGIFYSPDSFTSCYEKLWVTGSPSNPTLDSAATLVFNAMSGVAAEGSIYRFTPRFIQPETTSIKKYQSADAMLLSPNPAVDKITITGDLKSAFISVVNVSGEVINTIGPVSGRDFQFDVSLLPPGLYLLEINADNQLVTRKLCKTSQ